MISLRHRFHGQASIGQVYKLGKTVRGREVALRFRTREAGRPYRVSVVVSKKVSKSAVVRNRIRRRIYEIVRRNDSLFRSDTDLVFTVFSDKLATNSAQAVESEVLAILRKAGQKPSH